MGDKTIAERPWLYPFLLTMLIIVSCASTVQFVCIMAYFNKVSDPRIGGTYMTLLNTIANLGFKWMSTGGLWLMGVISVKECTEGGAECSGVVGLHDCTELGGECVSVRDGFWHICLVSFLLGAIWYLSMKGTVDWLADLAKSPGAWRVRMKAV